jgi:hypothetical protein
MLGVQFLSVAPRPYRLTANRFFRKEDLQVQILCGAFYLHTIVSDTTIGKRRRSSVADRLFGKQETIVRFNPAAPELHQSHLPW